MWRVWQAHLRRVLQVETVVKFEVDESDKRSIELHKRQHHSEIYITWHLYTEHSDSNASYGKYKHIVASKLYKPLSWYIYYLLSEGVRSNPRDGLPLYFSLVINTLDGQKHLGNMTS